MTQPTGLWELSEVIKERENAIAAITDDETLTDEEREAKLEQAFTKQEEEYVHFVSCIKAFSRALSLLREIKQSNRNSVVEAAFQLALIEYSKPYKDSYGMEVDAKGKRKQIKHKLHVWSIPLVPKWPSIFIPPQHIELHKRIIDLRDQILAHSDLTVMEATVYVEKSEHGKSANIVKNVILGTEEFENIDAIINLIEQSRDSMYEQEKIGSTEPAM